MGAVTTLKDKAFVADAGGRHTLAVVRSLGRRCIKVDTGSSSPQQLCAFSKYTHQAFLYPDPTSEPEEFVQFVLYIFRKKKYDALIPVGYNSNVTLSRYRRTLEPAVKVPIAGYAQLQIAAHKDETLLLAEKLGIPMPKTAFLHKINVHKLGELKYPLVVKGIMGSGRTYCVSSSGELIKRFSLLSKLEEKPPLVQEYIRGDGYGLFALFNRGEPRAIFMHKRIREYPITSDFSFSFIGGGSTVAESVYERRLKEYGLKILRALNWHGVAMVEFKRDREDNEFKLMEINPKFWGSLDLAIASGIDFPFLLYKMATEGDITPVFTYKTGVRFMWPFPDDFVHLLAKPSVATFFGFAKDFFNEGIRKNVAPDDLKPNIMQMLQTSVLAFDRIKGNLH